MHTLIASDIDGTLIPEETTVIPESVFEQVRAAHEKGFLFVAASGRQYSSLRTLFAPVADKMAFLAENGSGLYYQDRLICCDAFEPEVAMEIAQFVQNTPNCEFLADGEEEICVIPKSQQLLHQLVDVQKLQVRVVKHWEELPRNIMKIAVWCTDDAAQHDAAFRAAFSDRAFVAVSGHSWIDFSKSNKGNGVRAVCRQFGIPMERTFAFGDNWNDVTMLDAVAHPYIMQSAQPALREKYPQTCASVPEEMKKILQIYAKGVAF